MITLRSTAEHFFLWFPQSSFAVVLGDEGSFADARVPVPLLASMGSHSLSRKPQNECSCTATTSNLVF